MLEQQTLFPPGDRGDDDNALTLGRFAQQAYLDYAISVVKGRALPDGADGLKPVQRRILYAMNAMGLAAGRAAGEVGARRRRRARPLPPARRPGRVRRDGADGAGLLVALPADRRAGQLRQSRRRRCGGDALHGSAADADRATAARRDRRGHRRLHAELRRLHAGAEAAAGAAALRAAQRRLGHRRRHGHRDSVAQPARSRERRAAPDEGSDGKAGGRAAGDARPGLPGRRPAHLVGAGDPRRLRHRDAAASRPARVTSSRNSRAGSGSSSSPSCRRARRRSASSRKSRS